MDVEEAIRTRRTIKAYAPEALDRATLDELFELARWAPNHNLTNPWRFRVLGPEALRRLKEAAGPEAAAKLDRAPTLVVASAAQTGRAGAGRGGRRGRHVRRLHRAARRPRARPGAGTGARRRCCARPRAGRPCGLPDDEHFLGLLHLGRARQDKAPPERAPVDDFVTYLD